MKRSLNLVETSLFESIPSDIVFCIIDWLPVFYRKILCCTSTHFRDFFHLDKIKDFDFDENISVIWEDTIKLGSLNLLEWLRVDVDYSDIKYRIENKTIDLAVKYKKKNIFDWACRQQFSCSAKTFKYAGKNRFPCFFSEKINGYDKFKVKGAMHGGLEFFSSINWKELGYYDTILRTAIEEEIVRTCDYKFFKEFIHLANSKFTVCHEAMERGLFKKKYDFCRLIMPNIIHKNLKFKFFHMVEMNMIDELKSITNGFKLPLTEENNRILEYCIRNRGASILVKICDIDIISTICETHKISRDEILLSHFLLYFKFPKDEMFACLLSSGTSKDMDFLLALGIVNMKILIPPLTTELFEWFLNHPELFPIARLNKELFISTCLLSDNHNCLNLFLKKISEKFCFSNFYAYYDFKDTKVLDIFFENGHVIDGSIYIKLIHKEFLPGLKWAKHHKIPFPEKLDGEKIIITDLDIRRWVQRNNSTLDISKNEHNRLCIIKNPEEFFFMNADDFLI